MRRSRGVVRTERWWNDNGKGGGGGGRSTFWDRNVPKSHWIQQRSKRIIVAWQPARDLPSSGMDPVNVSITLAFSLRLYGCRRVSAVVWLLLIRWKTKLRKFGTKKWERGALLLSSMHILRLFSYLSPVHLRSTDRCALQRTETRWD